MRRLLTAIILCLPFSLLAQDGFIQEGEFGIGIGGAHYFGDLNTRAKINRPKPAATLFFKKNFGNYIAARISGTYAQLGYSDKHYADDPVKKARNLSFNTNVWEFGLQGDFNFYRFMPGDPYFSFTPYITMGLSLFSHNPFTYLTNPNTGVQTKEFLRPLMLEGQTNPYSSVSFAIPFGVGVKYALNDRLNVGAEVVHRFTNTDYLDDVSTVYASPAVFAGNPTALALYDRAPQVGAPLHKTGSQRGNSQTKDQFTTAIFYISFNLQSYKCPTAF